MQITQISRAYSRSVSFKKPDGTEMWIKHEMTASASVGESDMQSEVSAGLEEICRKEVGASIKAEKAKIEASFDPKEATSDEPFPGKTPGMKAAKMPKLAK